MGSEWHVGSWRSKSGKHPLSVECPTCHAPAGGYCTGNTITSRHGGVHHHYARFKAYMASPQGIAVYRKVSLVGLAPIKPKPAPKDDRRFAMPRLGAACTKGKHTYCTVGKCTCDCHRSGH